MLSNVSTTTSFTRQLGLVSDSLDPITIHFDKVDFTKYSLIYLIIDLTFDYDCSHWFLYNNFCYLNLFATKEQEYQVGVERSVGGLTRDSACKVYVTMWHILFYILLFTGMSLALLV
jgi:hypothetical protein